MTNRSQQSFEPSFCGDKAVQSVATCTSCSCFLEHKMSWLPCFASWSAISLPSPDDAPVTKTTFPRKYSDTALLWCLSHPWLIAWIGLNQLNSTLWTQKSQTTFICMMNTYAVRARPIILHNRRPLTPATTATAIIVPVFMMELSSCYLQFSLLSSTPINKTANQQNDGKKKKMDDKVICLFCARGCKMEWIKSKCKQAGTRHSLVFTSCNTCPTNSEDLALSWLLLDGDWNSQWQFTARSNCFTLPSGWWAWRRRWYVVQSSTWTSTIAVVVIVIVRLMAFTISLVA